MIGFLLLAASAVLLTAGAERFARACGRRRAAARGERDEQTGPSGPGAVHIASTKVSPPSHPCCSRSPRPTSHPKLPVRLPTTRSIRHEGLDWARGSTACHPNGPRESWSSTPPRPRCRLPSALLPHKATPLRTTRTGSRLRGHQPRQDPRVDPVRDTREGSEERGLRLGARTDRARRHSGREGAAPPLRVRRHDRRHRTVRERLSADVVEASRVTRARAIAHGDDQHAALALGVGREEPRGLVVVEGESGRAVAVRVSPEVDPPGADPASSCAARSPRAPSAPSPLIP
jgi:hypothetical protein